MGTQDKGPPAKYAKALEAGDSEETRLGSVPVVSREEEELLLDLYAREMLSECDCDDA
ncbi:MAG: hypothetical protein ACYTGB_18730 [Planctomycetota bacterium]|jgi:hypothetical protein